MRPCIKTPLRPCSKPFHLAELVEKRNELSLLVGQADKDGRKRLIESVVDPLEQVADPLTGAGRNGHGL